MKTPEQKTYVANAIAKHPSKRTAEEKATILESMTEWENEATMKTTQHTPGKWRLSSAGNGIGINGDSPDHYQIATVWFANSTKASKDLALANAQFIVNACNAYEELLEAIEEMRQVATGERQVGDDDTEGLAWIARRIVAIAKAQEKE